MEWIVKNDLNGVNSITRRKSVVAEYTQVVEKLIEVLEHVKPMALSWQTLARIILIQEKLPS